MIRRTMRPLDFIKATITCGVAAFLIYSYPLIGQVLLIAVLSLVWLSYLYRTFAIRR